LLKPGDVAIYESTSLSGATEEVCGTDSGAGIRAALQRRFLCRYSRSASTLADKEHRLTTIRKITAGSTPKAAEFVDALIPLDHYGWYALGLQHPGSRKPPR